jgi:monofunctional biosynthetic peptidoglycan transglycosylase
VPLSPRILVRRALKITGIALLVGGAAFRTWLFMLPTAEEFKTKNPTTTALMQARAEEAVEEGRPAARQQQWIPLSRMSRWLIDAVVNSEDARFFDHDGIDVIETEAALEKAVERGKLGRGASTITQQLAKNLWLGESRTFSRKLREFILARRLEALGKERVLELYLNVAEWGDGIYGAEAAARYWFHKSAADVDPAEAAVLAAMLPAPRKRNPQHPTRPLRRRAFKVLALYGMYHQLEGPDLRDARRQLIELLNDSRWTAAR